MKNRSPHKIVIVVVTFNRLSKLQHALDCYDGQTMYFDDIVVVDNHSTDGTGDYLKCWKSRIAPYNKHVISLELNTGGSGGFYVGEKFALTLNPDWIYISDDDAYPYLDVIELFDQFVTTYQGKKPSAITTTVLFPDGTINVGCRAFFSEGDNGYKYLWATENDYTKFSFIHNKLSYVGAFLSAEALRRVGLVNPDFFIYQDDFEHSIRLSSYGPMVCFPAMKVLHDEPRTPPVESVLAGLWKEYYACRNIIYLHKIHSPQHFNAVVLNSLKTIKAHRDNTLSSVNKMDLEAIKDARRGRLGLHSIYRPGLKLDGSVSLPYPRWRWKFVYWVLRICGFLKIIK